jgi:hypothetical protein
MSDTAQPDAKPQLPAKAPPPEFRTGGKLAALIPQSIEEAWRLAQYLAESDLAPRDMKKPAQIIVAIMAGAEVGLPPIQAIQSIAVINGRPTIWGDGLLAVVLARKVKVEEWMEGEGDERVAYCEVTRPDTGQVVVRSFSVADAKEAKLWMKKGQQGQDTPWVTYPRRMLQMRARSWAIRDNCADILRGIQVREEVVDYDTGATVTNPDERAPSPVSTFLATDVATGADATIDIVDASYEEPGGGEVPAATESENQPESATKPEPEAESPTEAAESPSEAPASPSEPEVVEVKAQPSGLAPTARWIAQVREAFEATKTKPEMKALEARWKSRANIDSLEQLRAQDPRLAESLERDYEALEQQIRGGK